MYLISTHTPHARRDDICGLRRIYANTFQLTRLMRGVTRRIFVHVSYIRISTHTPHARRDASMQPRKYVTKDFNSHASCEA